jgi:nucleoside-diphosphate-sugar epimerase
MSTEKETIVAVTGATGFLGSHLTERLLAMGFRVRILARDKAPASQFEGRVDAIVVGDITDLAALDNLMQGAEIVFHLVSNFRTASGPPESYYRINLEGTRVALEAAHKADVKRFVHCSTIGVHGDVQSTPANERSPYNPGDLYQQTKLEAEKLCFDEAAKGDMELVVIRPCSIYGPGDLRMLKMFRMLVKKTFLMVGPCQENFHAVYIDDLVDGFILAMQKPGISGEVFILGGGQYLSLRDYIQTAAKAVGAPMPWIRLPYWPMYLAGALCEAICVPLRIEPPLHRRRVRFYKNNRAFAIDKAKQLLGYSPKVDLVEGMCRTVAWYRDQHYL